MMKILKKCITGQNTIEMSELKCGQIAEVMDTHHKGKFVLRTNSASSDEVMILGSTDCWKDVKNNPIQVRLLGTNEYVTIVFSNKVES